MYVGLGNRLTGCIPHSTWSLYQSMSWMRSHPAFFVRCAEVVPSPCCGEALSVIGSRKQKLMSEGGDRRLLVIRRLRCSRCRKIHHELPDCVVPYKRYESACVEQVVSGPESSTVAADDATLRRWRNWFQEQTTYLLGALRSIDIRFHQDPAEKSSAPSQSVHHPFGHYVGDAPGWLARIVRPVANSNLWLHTRSAFLSALSCGRLVSKSTKRGAEKMKDQKKAEAIASERMQILSPLLAEGLDPAKAREIKQRICQQSGISERTLRRYLAKYREEGFGGLKPKGKGRQLLKATIPSEVLEQAILLRREIPGRSVAQLIQILEWEGRIKPGQIKRSTLQEKLSERGYSTRHMRMYAEIGVAARRFQQRHRNRLWHSDIKYGPPCPSARAAR